MQIIGEFDIGEAFSMVEKEIQEEKLKSIEVSKNGTPIQK